MSVNNQYLVIDTEPVKRYVKTIPSRLAGVRLDSEGKTNTGFILASVDGFSYDDEVLEVYTDREDRYIKQMNRKLFEEGFLKEYTGEMPDVDTTNLLSDEAIREIANIKNIAQMQKRINELTSVFSVQRVLEAAKEIGRPAKTVAVIEKRYNELAE